MEIFIKSSSCISHHNTFEKDFFFEDVSPELNSKFLFVHPAAYKDLLPANTIRRSSHILKMGLSTGISCLKSAAIESPDAIVVGTAIGCFEDTNKFLRSMIEQDEKLLAPTSFIQSTHNSVAGQLAAAVKCHGYNFTYVQQGLSFEHALADSASLIKEKEAGTVLVGAIDELGEELCTLFDRAGYIKSNETFPESIWNSKSEGFVAGEGAAFFLLNSEKESSSLSKLDGVKTIQKLKEGESLLGHVNEFLKSMGLTLSAVDLVMTGVSGDITQDRQLLDLNSTIKKPISYFKHLCGEYFTASGFAFWLSANILKKQAIPNCTMKDAVRPEKLERILIVNHFRDNHYSLICLSKC